MYTEFLGGFVLDGRALPTTQGLPMADIDRGFVTSVMDGGKPSFTFCFSFTTICEGIVPKKPSHNETKIDRGFVTSDGPRQAKLYILEFFFHHNL